MDAWLTVLFHHFPLWGLLAVIALAMHTLGVGAGWLVDEAVHLSLRWRVPKALIGATIVSLGTTLPEMAVSVLAALQGYPDLALGNAVGSIICNTGLILGLAALISPLPLVKSVVNRQGAIQLASAALLILFALPLGSRAGLWTEGGRIPRWAGFVMLLMLAAYMYYSIILARRGERIGAEPDAKAGTRSLPPNGHSDRGRRLHGCGGTGSTWHW